MDKELINRIRKSPSSLEVRNLLMRLALNSFYGVPKHLKGDKDERIK